MLRIVKVVCLVSAFLLAVGAIWPNAALATVLPAFESLGQLQEGFNSPTRVVADAEGNIYVANALGGTVVKYDRYKQFVDTYRSVPVYAGLAFSSVNDRLYVAEKTRVAIVDPARDAIVGYLHSGAAAADTFGYVIDMGVDEEGKVYVADASSNSVYIYGPDGAAIGQFGGMGISPGLMSGMTCLAVNSERGEIYIGDSGWDNPNYGEGSTRLQVFSLAGEYKYHILGRSDFGDEPLFNFSGLTYDSERLYVFDVMKGRLAIMSLTGSDSVVYLADAPLVSGYRPGEIGQPKDSVFDSTTDRLFVLSGKGAVEVFGIGGNYSDPLEVANTAPGLPVNLSPMGEVEVASPVIQFSAAQDSEDNVVSYEVRVLDATGEVLSVGMAGETIFRVAGPLAENGTYSWQVQAVDEGGLVSGWTEPSCFYVNAVQEAPVASVLTAPVGGSVIAGKAILAWTGVADPDPADTVTFRLEIDADSSFETPFVEEGLTAREVTLGSLPQYGDLKVGARYFWRVVAVDNHGVASASAPGSFVYDTSLLRVTASLPGAKVYLGGNHGYRGRYLGVAPVEVRDFEGGPLPVVVERAGFEPFVAQVEVGEKEKVSIYAELAVGLRPDGFKPRPVAAADGRISTSGGASPFAVDFNSDGITDLLVGTGAGHLFHYAGTGQGLEYGPAVELGLPQLMPGAAPCAVDWDNDGLMDLLIGGADGTVALLLNAGSQEVPVFPSAQALTANGAILDVGESAVAAVVDYDGDQAKDLVVGAAGGRVFFFANSGSDAAPRLQEGVVILVAAGQAAPQFRDWNCDGSLDLLLVDGTQIDVYALDEQGGIEPMQSMVFDRRLQKKLAGKVGRGGSVESGSTVGEQGLRSFLVDADGQGGKDIFVGNDAGDVVFVASRGVQPVDSFQEAILDKLSEINSLVVSGIDSGPLLSAAGEETDIVLIESLLACIDSSDYGGALGLVEELGARYDPGTELHRQLEELASLLEQVV